ncbi:MAG: hypothetical protein II702_09220 [Clostridia bacterium]|nr:hypothetical protein [Clostridia bacterium]
MKLRKTICILSALLLFMLPLTAVYANFGDYDGSYDYGGYVSNGETIRFGTYPQTDVTAQLGSELNGVDGAWVSYGYYSGSGKYSDGKMTASDFMRYKDVTYNNEKYRGVVFDSYRPSCTGYGHDKNEQYINGYQAGTTYWFKYEPLSWRVLDSSTGFVICETIIDSQPVSNYVKYNSGNDEFYNESGYYASDWETSYLRKWLNNDFYNTAFTENQKANIQTVTNRNLCSATIFYGTDEYSRYDSADTQDKIFLNSWDEVKNAALGFNSANDAHDPARKFKGSDYARCQGLSVSSTYGESYGYSAWWLRSPDYCSDIGCLVNENGFAGDEDKVNKTNMGVVPVMKLSALRSDVSVAPVLRIDGDNGGTASAGKTGAAGEENGGKLWIFILTGIVFLLIVIILAVLLINRKKARAAEPDPVPVYAPVQPRVVNTGEVPVAAPERRNAPFYTGHGGICEMCASDVDRLYSVPSADGGASRGFSLCRSCAERMMNTH